MATFVEELSQNQDSGSVQAEDLAGDALALQGGIEAMAAQLKRQILSLRASKSIGSNGRSGTQLQIPCFNDDIDAVDESSSPTSFDVETVFPEPSALLAVAPSSLMPVAGSGARCK